MALFASHIRFAMDLVNRNQCSPDSIDHYISGTTYPDSRWLSNTDRALTHVCAIPDNITVPEDFKLGWLVHCRYDQIQNELQRTLSIPSNLPSDDKWILYSAMKVIQDMNDVKFTVSVNLEQMLSIYLSPNSENVSDIETFYQMVKEFYQFKSAIKLSEYTKLWSSVGLSPDRIEVMMDYIESILSCKDIVLQIQNLYEKTVLEYLKQYQFSI